MLQKIAHYHSIIADIEIGILHRVISRCEDFIYDKNYQELPDSSYSH